MNWWGKYVGIPFLDRGRDMAGLDCWGLVRLIYAQERGIELPDYGEVSSTDLLRVARSLDAGSERWLPVEVPEAFDLVAMRLYDRAWIGHVGVMVDARTMIHTEDKIAVAVVPVNHFSVRCRIASYRRLRVD